MLFKAGQISMTLREWDDSTYDVTKLGGRKWQEKTKICRKCDFLPILCAENVIFCLYLQPKM